MAVITPASVFRRFVLDGVSSSGKHKPSKAEIIQLLNLLFGTSRGGWVVAGTKAELDGVTPANETDGGVVLDDPTASNNGYYQRDASAWVRERGFPDTFARVTLGGTANAQTGAVASYVNPADIEVFIAFVTTANTGPMTLSVGGETARDVVNVAGNALSAGEWTGVVLFVLNGDGDYQLIIDAGAAAAAAQSATTASNKLAEFLSHFLGNFADDAAAATAAGTPVEGQFYWNTTSKVYRYFDGSIWQAFPYATVADGAVTEPKFADSLAGALPFSVSDRTALKGLDTDRYKIVYLKEGGREGVFIWMTADYSAKIAADTQEGIYLKADGIAATSGAWVRIFTNVCLIEWFGGGLSVANNTTALNCAVSVAELTGDFRTILFPKAGTYRCTTAPTKFRGGIRIEGAGARSTQIVRNYTEAGSETPFLHWTGQQANTETSKGGGIANIGVFSGSGTTGGTAVKFEALDVTQRSGYEYINNLVISGGGEFDFGLYVDGISVTTVGSAGYRDLIASSIYVFRCRLEHVRLRNVKHVAIHSLQLNDGGLGVTPVLRINGGSGGSSEEESQDVSITGLGCFGNVVLTACQDVHIQGRASTVANTSSAKNCTFTGYLVTKPTNNSPSMTFYLPDEIILPQGQSGANFTRLPGNKILAEGTASLGTSASSTNYGVTFGSPPSVTLTAENGAAVYAFTTSRSTTAFNAAVNTGSGITVSWQAVGDAP